MLSLFETTDSDIRTAMVESIKSEALSIKKDIQSFNTFITKRVDRNDEVRAILPPSPKSFSKKRLNILLQ